MSVFIQVYRDMLGVEDYGKSVLGKGVKRVSWEEVTDLSRAGMFLLTVMALKRRMMWIHRNTAMLS